MARIPDEEIERLKREVSIERLVSGFGVELKRHGANLIGLCPFHDDHAPSLVVTPEKNLWNCLGACQSGGDAIEWVMRTRGVSFRNAVELLRADHPSLAAGDGRVVRHGTAVKLETPFAADAGRSARVARGGRLLPRDAEAESGSVAVSGKPRPDASGDDRPLQAGLCQPHARLSPSG